MAINSNGYVTGWNAWDRRFGVRIDDGEVTSLFPVRWDWEGFRFHGYAYASREEVLRTYGSKGAAMREWKRRFGGN